MPQRWPYHRYVASWQEPARDLAPLQQILGHFPIATTQRYARSRDDLEASRLLLVGSAGTNYGF